jgi:hypothetical protein
MMNRKTWILALGSLFCVAASAGVLGSFDVNGGGLGQVQVGATYINFYPLVDPTGTIAITGTTGFMIGLSPLTGTIMDLDSVTYPTGVPVSLDDFIDLDGRPTWNMRLTLIQPGVYGSAQCGGSGAPGDTCTPLLPLGVSPFNLSNTANGWTASFAVNGVVLVGGVETYAWSGVFTSQKSGEFFQSFLGGLLTGVPLDTSYSGSVTLSDIPEPATVGLILIALAALPLARRFRGV